MNRLSKGDIRMYAAGMDAKRFPFFCAATGELAESLSKAIRISIADLRKFGAIHRWKHTRAWQK